MTNAKHEQKIPVIVERCTSDDDCRITNDVTEVINEMMYIAEGGDCSPGSAETTLDDALEVSDICLDMFMRGALIAQLVDAENDGIDAFGKMTSAIAMFRGALVQLAKTRDEARKSDIARRQLDAVADAIEALTSARTKINSYKAASK